MKKIKLLDVTLRDGGYKTNFCFSPEVIRTTLTALDESGIEYIEIGYRNGSFKPIPNIGPAGLCKKSYILDCRKLINRSKLTVILHPKNIEEHDFQEMKNCGVESVRICFSPKDSQLAFKSIAIAKKYNFDVFVNITRASEYSPEILCKWIDEIEKYDIKAVYLADSNGSLTPKTVENLFAKLSQNCAVPLGLHAHDNLFLAQANVISAINNGAEYIDASLYGLGKGAGNLRTESIVSFLHTEGFNHYDLCKLFGAAEYINKSFQETLQVIPAKDIIMGIFDLSQDDALNLGEFLTADDYYIRAAKYIKKTKPNKFLVEGYFR